MNFGQRLELVEGKPNGELSVLMDEVHNSGSLNLELFTDWIDELLEIVDDCPWETLRKVMGGSSTRV